MKLLDIVGKDLRHFFGNVFSLVMMFAAPLLIPAIIFLAFGNSAGGFDLPVVRVALVNQDTPETQSGWSASQELINYLISKENAELISVVDFDIEEDARLSVKQGTADVAVIIPSEFTSAAMNPDQQAVIRMVSEPTITIGPQIVSALIKGFTDGLSGAKIAVQVATHQMENRGLDLGEAAAMGLAQRYIEWVEASAHADPESADGQAIQEISPMEAPADFNPSGGMIAQMMAAMIIFFVFFTGANGASMIIHEEEAGTLQRLFTTPTRINTLLGGKSLAVLITLAVQTSLLTLVARLVFGIAMGTFVSLVLSMLAMIIAAAGFGLFLMSFIRNSRQTGVVLGGVNTILAMLGGLFSAFVTDLPPVMNTIALFTPQGWAARSVRVAMAGAQPADILLPTIVLFGLGAIFFLAGTTIFRKRFA